MAEREDLVNIFVAVVPVAMDVLFKFWVFKYLRDFSPDTQAPAQLPPSLKFKFELLVSALEKLHLSWNSRLGLPAFLRPALPTQPPGALSCALSVLR